MICVRLCLFLNRITKAYTPPALARLQAHGGAVLPRLLSWSR